jgi:hypothetical protein
MSMDESVSNSKQVDPQNSLPASGVEQITEGYYRFHLPDVADRETVTLMKEVFEASSSRLVIQNARYHVHGL